MTGRGPSRDRVEMTSWWEPDGLAIRRLHGWLTGDDVPEVRGATERPLGPGEVVSASPVHSTSRPPAHCRVEDAKVWAIDAGVDVDADTGEDLAAYLRDWLDSQAPLLRATTVRSYRQMVEDYLIPQLGHHRLDGLDRRTLERAYRRLVAGGGRGGRPLRPSSVVLAHRVLHKALADAVVDGLLDTNPATAARPPRHSPTTSSWTNPCGCGRCSRRATSSPSHAATAATASGSSRWRPGCAGASCAGCAGTTSTSRPGR
jgi:hypothetical protein